MNYQRHKSEESVEDYLETILILSKQKAQVRSIDVANELGYSKPSVSVAMKNLRQKNYVLVSDDFEVLSYEVPSVEFSDHHPVFVRLKYNSQRQ